MQPFFAVSYTFPIHASEHVLIHSGKTFKQYIYKPNHLAIPEKPAVVGFGGSEVFGFFNPPLSCIQQPFEKIGQEAVRILLNQINGNTEFSQIQLAHEPFIRASGGQQRQKLLT